jgi:hypothetical protein
MNRFLKLVMQGKAQPKHVLWIGMIISIVLSVFIFLLFYFVNISSPSEKILESTRYLFVLSLGWFLLKNKNNAPTKLLNAVYGLIAIVIMVSSLYTLIQLYSNKPNITQATSLSSVSEIIKEVKEEQAVEAQRKQSRYYDICRREAEREADPFEEYTKEEWDRYEEQYGALIDDCLYRNENKNKICIDSFNKLYFDQGLDPDLYDNIRVEEVQRCLEGKSYR